MSKKDIIIISKKRDPEYILFKFYPEEKKITYACIYPCIYHFTYVYIYTGNISHGWWLWEKDCVSRSDFVLKYQKQNRKNLRIKERKCMISLIWGI